MNRSAKLIFCWIASTAIQVTAVAEPSAPSHQRPRSVDRYQLALSFDVKNHSIAGAAKLLLKPKGENTAGFLLNRNFTVESATIDGTPIELRRTDGFQPQSLSAEYGKYGDWDASKAALWTAMIPKADHRRKPLVLETAYRGSLYTPPDERKFSREQIAFEVHGTIGEEGIYLAPSSFWHPITPDAPAAYIVTAKLPPGWNCVTDGAPGAAVESDEWSEVTHISNAPSSGLSFSAGPYVVNGISHNGVEIYTYFLPEEASLSDDYITSCARYIDMYSRLIGLYPFPKFAVVDNFLPSGYGMPGWTLLGGEVLRLPFIKDVSLGHEVLHNWFGNSLFVDYRQGNWCEGLTSYLADYRYQADSDSAAAAYRMNLLRDYADYVNADNDYPVAKFSERSTQSDRAIGYGKVLMIFHMMRGILEKSDAEAFERVLRRAYAKHQWEAIGWKDWQTGVEEISKQDWGWFFDQWVGSVGAPKISVSAVNSTSDVGGWQAQLEVVTVFHSALRYPLRITAKSDRGITNHDIWIEKPRQLVNLAAAGKGELKGIILDPAFDLFRHIYPAERPLTLAAFRGDPAGILVVPGDGYRSQSYMEAAEGLRTEGQRVILDSEFIADPIDAPLWVFGGGGENLAWQSVPPCSGRLSLISGERDPADGGALEGGFALNGEEFRGGAFSATAIEMGEGGKPVVYTICNAGADPVSATRKLPHYGKYSHLVFDGDRNIRKGYASAGGENPMKWERAG